MSDQTSPLRRIIKRVLVPGSTTALLILAIVIGGAVGVGSSALIFTLDRLSEWTLSLTETQRLIPLVLVPTGLILAWLVARYLAHEVAGDGVPETMVALSIDRGHLRGRVAFLKGLATVLTVGLGGSVGREGPMVLIGGSLGSVVARWSGLGEDQVRSLVAAGAGAGIGASFNAPIAGMFFAIEVLLRNFALRHVSAVVVCSVSAAVTTHSLVGAELLFASPFSLEDPRQLILYGILGLLAVGASWVFLRLTSLLEDWKIFAANRWTAPLAAGLIVGGVGVFEPRLLSSGQDLVASLVDAEVTVTVWWVLGLLALGKIFMSVTTLAGRGSGGAFMPSLFIGAALGSSFAQLMDEVWTVSELQPAAFAVVGMAGMFAALARAPLTAILIVFEITGDYGLVLPLMLTASLATLLAEKLHREGVYTLPLQRWGIRLHNRPEVDILDTIAIGQVMNTRFVSVSPQLSTADLEKLFVVHRCQGVGVADQGRLLGIVTAADIVRAGGPSPDVPVSAAMVKNPITLNVQNTAAEALERLARFGLGNLPVVSADDPEEVVGMFRREDAVHAYQEALSTKVGIEHQTQKFRARTRLDTDFFECRVMSDSQYIGKTIREVPWPVGCTVVSIHRDTSVFVPSGSTQLEADDLLTIFGTTEGRRRLPEQVGFQIDSPTIG